MDKYTYLLLPLFLLAVWFVVFLFLKNESRKILVKASILGGLAGLMAEFWYFKDYWHPPSLSGSAIISLEDFLFGFAFTGIAATIYKVIFRKDLVVQSIMSGILSLLVIIPIYVLLFQFISPSYWDKYWLLLNTAFGIKVIGNIPATELLWYFSWSCFAGIAYDFYHGSKDKVLR